MTLEELDIKLKNLFNQKDYELALKLAKKITKAYPSYFFGWKLLGTLNCMSKNFVDGVFYFNKALKLNPNDHELYNNIGNAQQELKNLNKALVSFNKAIELKPDFLAAHYNLANLLSKLERFEKAEKSYKDALSINPNYPKIYYNLANTLKKLYKYSEAEYSYKKAINLDSNYISAYKNLAMLLVDLRKFDESKEIFHKLLEFKPNESSTFSNLIFNLNYGKSINAIDILNEAKKYGEIVSKNAYPKYVTKLNSNKKLKIGFVSGDFKKHPVAYFTENLFSNINKNKFDIYAFSSNLKEDDLTQRIKPFFNEYINITELSDFDAAKLIYDKKIDILIDLSGHTGKNRLPVFSYKPAYIQASWLGYLGTTGLPEMDFYIGDRYMTPKKYSNQFTEKIYNLPNTSICFNPPDKNIEISSLPAIKNGYITFGCFNNLNKVNIDVLKLWASILKNIPSSKLFLKSSQLTDEKLVKVVKDEFKSLGISEKRLILKGFSITRTEHFETYNQIDIALEPFPYPGITTTVEALWMGVPVLTLKGDRCLLSIAESIAHNINHDNWISADKNDYLKKAIYFSRDFKYLANLRSNLRQNVLNSPLFDSKSFAKDFEEALINMYENKDL